MHTHCPLAPKRQHGAALLALMLVIFLAATAFYLRQGSANHARRQVDSVTARAMAQAKEALIGRAAADINRPGSLPCPDVNDDGEAELLPGNKCPSYIGRIPWKTLDIPDPLDGSGERLWYALAPGLRDNAAAQPINPSKALELTLDGVANVAAIVFSPGAPLASQSGRPSNSPTDYLDGSNADGDTSYVSASVSAPFNDQALAITRDDVFRVVDRRVIAEIRGPDNNAPAAPKYGLRDYFAVHGSFPPPDINGDGKADTGETTGRVPYLDVFADTTSPPGNWLTANQWFTLVTYTRLASDRAQLAIGTRQIDVTPCSTSPCP